MKRVLTLLFSVISVQMNVNKLWVNNCLYIVDKTFSVPLTIACVGVNNAERHAAGNQSFRETNI